MDDPTVSKKKIQEAEQEAEQELLGLIKKGNSHAIIDEAKETVRLMEQEIRLREEPYGHAFAPKKTHLGRAVGAKSYFPGVSTKILDIKRTAYLNFIKDYEKELEQRRPVYILPRELNPYYWNVPELRQMCRSEGLPDYGDKHILVARLKKVKK